MTQSSINPERPTTYSPNILRPTCPLGYDYDDLVEIFGEGQELHEFQAWMEGQTVGTCDSRKYNLDTRQYEPTVCATNPHGTVTYRRDVHAYLDWKAGGPVPIFD